MEQLNNTQGSFVGVLCLVTLRCTLWTRVCLYLRRTSMKFKKSIIFQKKKNLFSNEFKSANEPSCPLTLKPATLCGTWDLRWARSDYSLGKDPEKKNSTFPSRKQQLVPDVVHFLVNTWGTACMQVKSAWLQGSVQAWATKQLTVQKTMGMRVNLFVKRAQLQ